LKPIIFLKPLEQLKHVCKAHEEWEIQNQLFLQHLDLCGSGSYLHSTYRKHFGLAVFKHLKFQNHLCLMAFQPIPSQGMD